MSEDIVKESIKCLANMEIKDTTYQVARSVVLDEIERLQKENKKLKLCLGIVSPSRVLLEGKYWEKEDNEEIERLNNIINELEHYLKLEKWKSIGGIHLGVINGVLDKLQRLKGSDKE